MSSTDEIAAGLAKVPNVELLVGVFVSGDGVHAVVDVGNARVTVPTLGHAFPVPGENVRLLRVNKTLLMLGPANPRSPIGRVSATGSPRCTVEYPSGSGVTLLMGYPSNINPDVNDLVLIDWTSGGTVVDKITAYPGYVVPENPSGGGGSTTTQVFTAVDAGTKNTSGGSWWQAQVWASDSTQGAWFYGSKIRDTIPDAAVITSAEIYLPIVQAFGDAPNLRVHTSEGKEASLTWAGSAVALDPRSGWVGIPTSMLDYLKSNPGGLGMNSGGFNKYASLAADGSSGAIRVTYST